MPRKRKSGEEELSGATSATSANTNGNEVYEKGGRVLRVRDTCMCPVCGVYFSPAEIQAHAQACLYFLEQLDTKKKSPKKGLSVSSANVPSTPPKHNNLSRSDSSVPPSETTPKRPKVSNTPKWKPNTVAQWNIPYAPVFRPTVAEFKRPLDYISKIRPIAEKYGICVIVPPYPAESWNQQIGDPKTFSFRTKVQHIHQLKTRWQGRNEVFVSNLASFLEKRGEPLKNLPRVDGRDLDLFKLFTSVVNRGGYQVVERANLWKSVADDLKLSIVCVRNNTLRNHYHKYLHTYELYRKSKLQFKPASANPTQPENTNPEDDDLYIAEDITGDLYNTDYLEEDENDDEFGFYEGEEYTLSSFEKKARTFSEKWFPNNKPSPEQVEEEFWRIVETAEDSVKVDYGSDLDVTKFNRSGFPRDRMEGVYVTENGTHWNLNRLPRMRGSVLSHIKETVAGVTDPMLYVGMLFSSFCWHTEDNYLYSINYMHKGTAKTWYGVPASAAEKFEEVMKEAVPDLFLKHPDLLHLLITMISPNVLNENKVPIVRAVQEPGQYVITFPKAYHAGFSHGFTCAEAVNFAPADWLPYGYESVLHYRTIKRPSVFSHEELMFTIANRDPSPETAYWLCGELQKLREREQSARDLLRLAGFLVQLVPPPEPRQEPKQCKVCNYDCFLSSVTCNCSPQHVACLTHHAELCESCSSRSRTLQVHIPLNELDVLIEKTRKLQIQTKPVIDLTDDDEAKAPASIPNMANMNNVTPQLPSQPSFTTPILPISNKPSRSPIPSAQSFTTVSQNKPTTPPSPPSQQTTPHSPQREKETQQSPLTPQTPQSTLHPQQAPQTPLAHELSATEQTVPIIPQVPTSPHDPPATPSFPSSQSLPDAPKKGIVINLTINSRKKGSPPNTNLASNSYIYQNKIPPVPSIRSNTSSNLNVSSFTSFAAKQGHVDYSSSSSSSSASASSSYPPAKPFYYYEDGTAAQPPSPSDHMQVHGKKSKPVHIILDSPPKA